MERHDDREQRLKELFTAARRVDRETAPDWHDLRTRPQPGRRFPLPLRAAVFTLATAATIVALFAATSFIGTGFRPERALTAADHAVLIEPESPAKENAPAGANVPDATPSSAKRDDANRAAPTPGVDTAPSAVAAGKALSPPPPPPPRPRRTPPPRTEPPPGPVALRAVGSPARMTESREESAPASIGSPAAAAEAYVERARAMATENLAATPPPAGTKKAFRDEFVQDLPVPGRFYQNVTTVAPGVNDADGDGNPTVDSSRSPDFQVRVSGVSNVDPLTGQLTRRVNADSIEGMEVVSSGAGVEFGRVQGGIVAVEEEVAGLNTESYAHFEESGFVASDDEPLSTFSIDVDTASYALVRRFLASGQLPPKGAVRIEEMINYFTYDYPEPTGVDPFSITVDVGDCPWNPDHRLARIGLKGRAVIRGDYPGSNLVFLIDVSGSMRSADKLDLLKAGLTILTEQLDGRDQVAIVTYAGSSGVVLPSTPGSDSATIQTAIANLQSGGSTNGAAGIRDAYAIARENFIRGGVNRVILATDGDFNVGVNNPSELLDIIRADADNGIFLTTLGVGRGNYRDDMLEQLADKGNGNYHYLDSLREARKVLVDDVAGTLVTIAKDVKIQVEFNPTEVGAYRLIGYDNRRLAKQDFNDDTKDAGEIGAGHTVTALYEIVPPGEGSDAPRVDPLRYQRTTERTAAAGSGELMTVKVRYKRPEGHKSRLLTHSVVDAGLKSAALSSDFRLAASVAELGLVLRGSEYGAGADPSRILEKGADFDETDARREFVELVRRAVAAGAAHAE